ncbi:MAG: helix-turn-helix domain-containing protein [Microscillaceae bacterium]|jgi:AraC-like DNA-binding protein|nr:helix-turn-helix domain-containing protein [Microscillaceae bacterium]
MIHEIQSLNEYCQHIRISLPKHSQFDIRRFEDNMLTVKAKVEPFRHQFFAIALKLAGGGSAKTGFSQTSEAEPSLFFNTPYQITSWDIKPDWEGYYIIFTQDFIQKNQHISSLLYDFPFLRMDQSIPLTLESCDIEWIKLLFDNIFDEYHSANSDKFDLIQAFTHTLLLYVRRAYNQTVFKNPEIAQANRRADISLTARFQTLIEQSFAPNQPKINPHSLEYYADELGVHPNHLNATSKRITGKNASQLVQNQVLILAKSLLAQTDLSIKEIAYQLYFKEPTHFNAFFKKLTQITPAQFREDNQL